MVYSTNMTENKLRQNGYMTVDDILEGCEFKAKGDEAAAKICVMNEELRQGLSIVKSIEKGVTIYGSARLPEGSPYYEKARSLGSRLSTIGYTVITGGGPGIMEAANRGSYETGGESVGITITLPNEQETNPYVKTEAPFYYFFTRKTTLSFSADCFVAFPGGFGTLDEVCELLALVQNNKIKPTPIILFGSDFWKPFDTFIRSILFEKFETVEADELSLYKIVDTEEEVIEIVKNLK